MAHADLEGRAVLHQFRDVVGDALGHLPVGDMGDGLDQRLFVGDQEVDLVDVNETVACGAGHPGVDLGDDGTGIPARGVRHVHRDAHAAESETVRRAHLDQRRVQADLVAVEKVGDLGKVGRDIIDFPFEGRLAHGGADEKELEGKPFQKRRVIHVFGQGEGEHLVDEDVLHIRVGDHAVNQVPGLTAPRSDEDAAPLPDLLRLLPGPSRSCAAGNSGSIGRDVMASPPAMCARDSGPERPYRCPAVPGFGNAGLRISV